MAHKLYVPRLRRNERRRIQKALSTCREARDCERFRAMLWSEQRRSIDEIAQLLGRHPDSVRRWIKHYQRGGFATLKMGKSPGAPRRLDADGEGCVREALAANPRDLGYRFTRWSLNTLREHLGRCVHVQVSQTTMSRTLKRLRYRYKRPKLSLKHRQKRRDVKQARETRDAALKKL